MSYIIRMISNCLLICVLLMQCQDVQQSSTDVTNRNQWLSNTCCVESPFERQFESCSPEETMQEGMWGWQEVKVEIGSKCTLDFFFYFLSWSARFRRALADTSHIFSSSRRKFKSSDNRNSTWRHRSIIYRQRFYIQQKNANRKQYWSLKIFIDMP